MIIPKKIVSRGCGTGYGGESITVLRQENQSSLHARAAAPAMAARAVS